MKEEEFRKYLAGTIDPEKLVNDKNELKSTTKMVMVLMSLMGVRRIFNKGDLNEFLYRLYFAFKSHDLLDNFFGDDKIIHFKYDNIFYEISIQELVDIIGVEVSQKIYHRTRDSFFVELDNFKDQLDDLAFNYDRKKADSNFEQHANLFASYIVEQIPNETWAEVSVKTKQRVDRINLLLVNYDNRRYSSDITLFKPREELIIALKMSGLKNPEDRELMLELVHLWNLGYVEFSKSMEKYFVKDTCQFNYGNYRKFNSGKNGFVDLERIAEKFDLFPLMTQER